MLAYVFWHAPRAGVPARDYEARLEAFHAALQAAPAAGMGPTATVALPAIPWLGGEAGYEDWYLVDDFPALGALNDAAVSGRRAAPHDAAAAVAGSGVAGVMGHLHGPWLPSRPGWAAWLQKPAGETYDAFHADLGRALAGAPDACAWQRQMVLGPAAEYCVLAGGEIGLPWPARAWPVRTVVAPPIG